MISCTFVKYSLTKPSSSREVLRRYRYRRLLGKNRMGNGISGEAPSWDWGGFKVRAGGSGVSYAKMLQGRIVIMITVMIPGRVV